jgi:glycosyltransferase involved in cell wall biosynthesis
MRVVCISAAKIPSDTANSIQVMKVCQAFVQLGLEVMLLVPETPNLDTEKQSLLKHYGLENLFPIEWLPMDNRRLFPWKAALRAWRLKAELVYAWPPQAAVLARMLAIPSMLEVHDIPTGRFGPIWLRFFRWLPGRKRFLPITRALQEALHLPDDLTVIAPDGVDIERYRDLPSPEKARQALNLPQNQTVLCTGHLYAGRGVELFLSLAGNFPQTSFVWVGGRPEDVESWRNKASHLMNVTFTGFIPNQQIPLYQSAADVLLMPYGSSVSTSSGGNTAQVCSPMKMFEYMAAGRAILSSDLTVLHEVLNKKNAVFCPPDDVQTWVHALAGLLSDPEKRNMLGRNANSAVPQYSWTARAKRSLKGFYEISA